MDGLNASYYSGIVSYPIIEIAVDSPVSDEPMGTKRKFWLVHDGRRCLFKYARVNKGIATGEDWSEKIAYELSRLIGITAAPVELAVCGGQRGIVSFDVTRRQVDNVSGAPKEKAHRSSWEPIGPLFHGNELLSALVDSTYPIARMYRVSEHTVDRVIGLLAGREFLPPCAFDSAVVIDSAADAFVGYLLLDAWIGNTDRHHENWGVIVNSSEGHRLCPSYDHASSLGREMSEEDFKERLTTNDRNRSIETYVAKARSAFFAKPDDEKPLSPMDAFERAAQLRQIAGEFWRNKLREIDPKSWRNLIYQIPDSLMSDHAKRFVDRMLQITRQQLLTDENPPS